MLHGVPCDPANFQPTGEVAEGHQKGLYNSKC